MFAACSEPETVEVAPRTLEIARSENVVRIVEQTEEDRVFTTLFTLDGSRVRLEQFQGQRLLVWIELAASDGDHPSPRGRAGSFDVFEELELSEENIIFGDKIISRSEFAETTVGRTVSALAELHIQVPALMAETEGYFALAAWVRDDPRDSWPKYSTELDDSPPGWLEGDVLGLGMICASFIRCPGSAPFCVTVDHQQTYGFCSRSCVGDAQCSGAREGGRCDITVSDTPGISGAVRMCVVGCGEGDVCPGRLSCEREPGAVLCLPDQVQ